MKVTDFLGRRVVDNEAMEIGKVSDVIIEPKEAVITGIQISTGEFGLRKTDLFVTPAEIQEVGDYLLLNIKKNQVRGVKDSDEEEKKSLKL
ncbi:MAG: PRC-barrel domain-containing protein [Methanobacterium sp.]|nr:PRC-barrel domain-containing protein [Methanobacterium sp.]